MSNQNRVENKDEKVGRKGYLKGLVAGFLGVAAFLKLTDIPKVNAALSGSGADKQITYWTGTETIAGSSDFTWDYNTGQKIFTAGDLKWDDTDKTLTTNNLKWEDADTKRNFIGGHSANSVTTDVVGATISGGGNVSPVENKVTDDYGTIGGGQDNQAGDNGGTTTDKSYATVGGGRTNTASGYASTVAGGYTNTASGNDSTVSGGGWNTASGDESIICGGFENTAGGTYSFAAGRRAKVDAAHDGAFLFADDHNVNFNSVAANEFAVRCVGGARFVTAVDGAGIPTRTVAISSDGEVTASCNTSNPTVKGENTGSGTGVHGVTANGVGVLAEKTGYGWALSVKGKSKFGGWVIPTMDNKYKLGYGAKRWKAVHAADGVITTSLSMFKENIEDPGDIDFIESVPKPIYFNWKDSDDKEKRLGFMGDHLPEIARDDDGGIYTSSVTAILCGAVKQLKEENKQLKEDYETMIRQLEKRIEQLEKNN